MMVIIKLAIVVVIITVGYAAKRSLLPKKGFHLSQVTFFSYLFIYYYFFTFLFSQAVAMENFFEREMKRLAFVDERMKIRAQEKIQRDAEETKRQQVRFLDKCQSI